MAAAWVVRCRKHPFERDAAMYATRAQTMLDEKNRVILLPWDELPSLPDVSWKELADIVQETYENTPRDEAENWASQIRAFRVRMKPGDLVVVIPKPEVYERDWVAVAEITGEYCVRTDLADKAVHARSVEWINKKLTISDFPDDIANSICEGVMDCCQIMKDDPDVPRMVRYAATHPKPR